MTTFTPDLCFKGERTYVHGTSLYETALQGAAATGFGTPDGPFTLDLRRRLASGACFHFHDAESVPPAPENAVAGFNLSCGGRKVSGWVEPTETPVTRRISYDEGLIRNATAIAGETIRLTGLPPFQPFEICAAMAVQLHNTLFPPAPGERWMLTQVKLARPLAETDLAGLRLNFQRRLGERVTRTSVAVSDQSPLGTLTFMLARM